MTERGSKSKHMIITADTETGKIVSILDENGRPATKVTDPDEMDKVHGSPAGFRHVATILYAHSSPGCFYLVSGGWAYKICW
jgi:hypothetical protein